MTVSRGTMHSIQCLRFVAATVVVIFHAQLAIAGRMPDWTTPTEDYFYGLGACGVHMFFVISGYIMYLTNVARPRPFAFGHYYKRRLVRIFPAYWIYLAIYLVVEGALGMSHDLGMWQLLGVALLWPWYAASVIGPAWTLSYELYFYFVFGLAFQFGSRRGLWIITAGFALCIAAGFALRPSIPILALATNSLLLEFIAGVWIAKLTTTTCLRRGFGWFALGGGVAGFALGHYLGYDRLPSVISWGGPSALVVTGAVILEQTATGGWRASLIRQLSTLGDSSYSLYLSHLLLVILAVRIIVAAPLVPSIPLLVACISAVCIVVAHSFYVMIERPIVRGLHLLTERGDIT